MDGQRPRANGSRRRRSKKSGRTRGAPEPVLIAARRPNAPVVAAARGHVVASAAPKRAKADKAPPEPVSEPPAARRSEAPPKRQARIIAASQLETDDRERQRQKLLARVMVSEGRGAISLAARDYEAAGFDFPDEQAVQLQLLEHFDEGCARRALQTLEVLLRKETPLKRPVFEQRLRRLEEYADDPSTRQTAAELRRAIRA